MDFGFDGPGGGSGPSLSFKWFVIATALIMAAMIAWTLLTG